MKPIELERWEPSPDDPRRKVYAGQRTAQEVFEELKYRLENMGYLPDEYFLLNREWENGREIPKDADIFCTADYGGSEGVYLDVYLKWYEKGRPVIRSFITGKTLGESGSDLDRIFLISSAITKAFHGDRGTYARYLRRDEQPEPEDMILHLDPAEQRTLIQALVEQRERQEQPMSQTEQILRRMTGSITAYMDEVGRRPLHLSDYDKAPMPGMLPLPDGPAVGIHLPIEKEDQGTGDHPSHSRPIEQHGPQRGALPIEKADGCKLQQEHRQVDLKNHHGPLEMASGPKPGHSHQGRSPQKHDRQLTVSVGPLNDAENPVQ